MSYISHTNTPSIDSVGSVGNHVSCEGCYLLKIGQGGETQSSHMYSGGCLYKYHCNSNSNSNTPVILETQFNQNETTTINITRAKENLKKYKEKQICIICSYEFETASIENKHICIDCTSKEVKDREMRYRNYRFMKYGNLR